MRKRYAKRFDEAAKKVARNWQEIGKKKCIIARDYTNTKTKKSPKIWAFFGSGDWIRTNDTPGMNLNFCVSPHYVLFKNVSFMRVPLSCRAVPYYTILQLLCQICVG